MEGAIKGVIAAMLVLVVGLSLVPTIYTSSNSTNTGISSGASRAILDLVPLIFVIGILMLGFVLLKGKSK